VIEARRFVHNLPGEDVVSEILADSDGGNKAATLIILYNQYGILVRRMKLPFRWIFSKRAYGITIITLIKNYCHT